MAAATAVIWGPRNFFFFVIRKGSSSTGEVWDPPRHYSVFLAFLLGIVKMGCRWDVHCEGDLIAFDCIAGHIH